jgi:CheY-like chemotaxis protein
MPRIDEMPDDPEVLRRRLEAADRQLERTLRFLAVLEHDLRDPLAPIASAVSVLQLGAGQSQVAGWAAEVIGGHVRRLEWLVDDLNDRGLVLSGRLHLARGAVEVTEIVTRARDATREFFDRRHQELIVTLPPGRFVLDADPRRLSRALAHLLDHAGRSAEPGQTLRMLGDAREGLLALTLQFCGASRGNGGELVAPHQDPLDQELGVGLNLARQIIELHGGQLEIRSTDLGSECVLTLPLLAADRREPAVVAEPNGRTHRILVVDDNRLAADSLATLLHQAGHLTWTAYNGQEALEQAEAALPDVLLLDLGLPDQDGYRICSAIREKSVGRRMLIVAVTGWGQTEARLRSSAAGFDAHLVKPVYPDDILRLISNHLRIQDQEGEQFGSSATRDLPQD